MADFQSEEGFSLIELLVFLVFGFIGAFLVDLWLTGGRFMAALFGSAPGIGRWIWDNIWFVLGGIGLLMIVLFGGIVWAVKRAENKWEFKRLYDVYKNLIRNKFWINGLDRVLFFTRAWRKRRILSDRFPELLRENIVYLFALNNYLKRFYIWKVKAGQVTDAHRICDLAWKWINPYNYYYGDYENLLEDIHKCRDGGNLEVRDEDDPTIILGYATVGIFPSIKEFCDMINEASEFLANVIGAYRMGKIDETQLTRFRSELDKVMKKLQETTAKLETSRSYLEDRAKALGNFQLIKAQVYLILDQCNPYGQQEHQYRFIPDGTRLVDQFGHESYAHHSLEVDMYGNVLDDVNSNKNQFYGTLNVNSPIRRVAPEEIRAGKIKLMAPPYEIMDKIENDWEGGFRTMRFGQWKKYSKSFSDYVNAWETRLGKTRFYNEENITFEPGTKEQETAAFDRRARVDPGKMDYPGRINVHHVWQDVSHNPREDPFPGVSSIGMSNYIIQLAQKDTENMKEMNDYLNRFIQDIGLPVQTAGETPKTFKPLRGKEE